MGVSNLVPLPEPSAGLPFVSGGDHPLEEPITQKPVQGLLGKTFREMSIGRGHAPSPDIVNIT
jgi:hypothetical protein